MLVEPMKTLCVDADGEEAGCAWVQGHSGAPGECVRDEE